jgi:hypothetical protein
MVILEIGLMFRGYVLVNACRSDIRIDKSNRSSLLSAIMTFAQSAFSYNKLEYLEVNKYIITVSEDTIKSRDNPIPEPLIGYAVLEKKKRKPEKYLRKVIKPLINRCIESFKEEFNGKYLAEVSQFIEFKEKLFEFFELKKTSNKKIVFPLN